MNFKTILPDKSVALFVKNILLFEEPESQQKTVLPFFADGYPGLIFHETETGLWVSPQNKQMPLWFLHGQTINPVELVMEGAYKLVVFQLYPFVLKSFFNIEPKDINDGCYNLEQHSKGTETVEKLKLSKHNNERVNIITAFLLSIFQNKQKELDLTMASAIRKIISTKGQLSIGALYEELHLTERTFERRFSQAAGISAKQFAKIIQFQQSLEQLTAKDYTRLTDIVYANGFADQSHFIKVFKAFTGKTPLAFTTQK